MEAEQQRKRVPFLMNLSDRVLEGQIIAQQNKVSHINRLEEDRELTEYEKKHREECQDYLGALKHEKEQRGAK